MSTGKQKVNVCFICDKTDASEEQINYQDNLSPNEIRKKIDNYTKGKELALTENEINILDKIKKPLEEYEEMFTRISSEDSDKTKFDQSPLMIKKRFLILRGQNTVK